MFSRLIIICAFLKFLFFYSKRIRIRSRMWDACLVIDGGVSFKFNDGAVATFEIAENNALRTVAFD